MPNWLPAAGEIVLILAVALWIVLYPLDPVLDAIERWRNGRKNLEH